MREIKFRAWDNCCNMFEITEISFERGICFYKHGLSNTLAINEIELMQYTGLKDKNGVEVFEGDIIKTSNGISQVWYGHCAFGLVKGNGDFEDYMCNICDMNGRVYEVIGNIYEHKHLLHEKDEV